jgi:hypothetical protein
VRLAAKDSSSPAIARSAELLEAAGWNALVIPRTDGGQYGNPCCIYPVLPVLPDKACNLMYICPLVEFFEAATSVFTAQDGELDWLIVTVQATTCTRPQVWSSQLGSCEMCPDGSTPTGDSVDDCTPCPAYSAPGGAATTSTLVHRAPAVQHDWLYGSSAL